MRPFTLNKPKNLAAASKAGAGKDTAFKAAGIDLLDRLKERVESPGTLVDLLPLAGELRGVARVSTGIRIGALTTLQQVAGAPDLDGPAHAALTHAAGTAATPQIRNRATVGGNLVQKTRCWYLRSAAFHCAHDGVGDTCLAVSGENRYHAVLGTVDCMRVHPSNLAPALTVLGAVVRCWKDGEQRSLHMDELYPRSPAARTAEHTLRPGEVITAVDLPDQPDGTRSAYSESREKQSFDWPTTAAAVRLAMDGGTIASAAICLGAVAPIPWPARGAAAWLEGKEPTDEVLQRAAELAFEGAQPLEHNAYKLRVGRAVLVDALMEAAGRKDR